MARAAEAEATIIYSKMPAGSGIEREGESCGGVGEQLAERERVRSLSRRNWRQKLIKKFRSADAVRLLQVTANCAVCR